MAKKPANTKKQFPDMPEAGSPTNIVHQDLASAAKAAEAEAKKHNVMPTAIMHSAPEGYVTGDGNEHSAGGIDAEGETEVKEDKKVVKDDDKD